MHLHNLEQNIFQPISLHIEKPLLLMENTKGSYINTIPTDLWLTSFGMKIIMDNTMYWKIVWSKYTPTMIGRHAIRYKLRQEFVYSRTMFWLIRWPITLKEIICEIFSLSRKHHVTLDWVNHAYCWLSLSYSIKSRVKCSSRTTWRGGR